MLLAIDPGQTSGWALFDSSKRLTACGLGHPQVGALTLSRAVIERPVIYPGGRTKNPNDVLSVAVNAGEWGGWARAQGIEPEYVKPSQWKGGSVRKDIQHARDFAKLTPEEQEIVGQVGKGIAPSKREHFLDAVGIGLWAVKR